MPGIQPVDIDVAHYQRWSADFAQARTLEDGVARCLALIEGCFAPRACQIVWEDSRGRRLLGGFGDTPFVSPEAAEYAWLSAGELALISPEQPSHCFAPLRVRGALAGWLFLDAPQWSAESPALLAALAAQAGPVLALLEAERQQEERIAQLRTLTEIGRVLSSVLDLDTLLDAIYDATRRAVDVSNFYIGLYDSATDLITMAYYVWGGERRTVNATWRPSEGLTGVLVAQRYPLLTDDYQAECARRGIVPPLREGVQFGHAWLGVPLFVHDRLIGVLNVSSLREDYTYSVEHADLLATIGAQAAVAIENARLYQHSSTQARQLTMLNEIGRIINSSLDPEQVPSLIMNQACSLLGVEEGSLLLVDEQTGDLVFTYTSGPVGTTLLGQRLPRGVGLAGYVVTHGVSVIVNDAQQDSRFYADTDHATGYVTRTLLAVPLRGVGGVLGVIEVLNRRDSVPFTRDDQRLLEAVADQAVIALENANRFAQVDRALARRAQELAQTNDMLQHNLRSLTALNALGMAINTALRTPDEIFGMTARGVVEMTAAASASVLLPERDHFQVAVHIGIPPVLATLEPIARQVLRTERSEVVRADAESEYSLFAAPLRTPQRMLGVLCVCYDGALPDESDQETVVLFATQAAGAVENMRLFTEVRTARDQMASILASTREGIALIDPNARIALANTALHRLCGVGTEATNDASVAQFLTAWEQASSYTAEDWAVLRKGIDVVTSGRERFAFGELNGNAAHGRSIEWATLTVHSGVDSRGGALLVLRDITEAKETERLRQDLTHMIIHDLRSPLSSVMASIDMLTRGVPGEINPTQQSVLGIAYKSALQMLEMVNTLLDISRLESGRMPLELNAWPISALLERAIEQLGSLARDRDIAVQRDVSVALPRVWADQELVVRVVQNLLANAFKFSGRGSAVLVSAHVTSDERQVQIAVSDRGIGIAPKDQEKIFTKFGQVGEKRGGTGLGLTFCKLVVEAHQGRIWVESTLGKGSTFLFTLPIAEQQDSD
jgi:signal transduction histidine kinase